MQRTLVLIGLAVGLAAMLILMATLGLAFVAEERTAVSPRGPEGPDIRRIEKPPRPGCDAIRRRCPTDSAHPVGPDVR